MRRTLLLLSCTLLLACAGDRRADDFPTFDQPPPVTPDGLERVDSPVFELVYVKPGVDLARYDQIRIRPIGLGYKADPSKGKLYGRSSNFALSDRQRTAVSRALAGAFSNAMTRDGRYRLVTSRLENAMQIQLALAQLEVNIPEGDEGERVMVSKVGELTLVVEISDALTGEALVRGRDSYVLQNMAGGETRADLRVELNTLFERWCNQIRSGLDQLSAQE